LLKRAGFDPKFKGPIFGMVCRLAEQKGVDLVWPNWDFFLERDVKLIVLGSGEKRMEADLQVLAAQASDKIFLSARLDEAMKPSRSRPAAISS